MAEQRWWIRPKMQLQRPTNRWHLQMHEGEAAACGQDVAAPLERVTDRPARDAVCDECLRIEPFARGMSHAVGSRGEGGRLPETP